MARNKEKLLVIGLLFIVFILILVLFLIHVKPHITVDMVNNFNMSGEYKEVKAKAHFLSKDLTDRIEVKGIVNPKKAGQYELVYAVKYGKLKEEKKVIVNIIDDIKPKLALKGDEVIYLDEDEIYKEPGYKASDNNDGELTAKVKVENKPQKSAGTYNVKYVIKDSSGNETSLTRIVKRIALPKQKTIYLTFDDGPSSNVTPRILDILKKENVKATFFVVKKDKSLNKLIKREHDEGHTVALHSATHDYDYVYKSKRNYFKDLEEVRNYVAGITGETPEFIRFPGGSSNTVSMITKGIMSDLSIEVVKKGYEYFDWNIDSGDTGRIGPKKIFSNVKNSLGYYKANVILMHDYEANNQTAEALQAIIRYGKKNGYKFDSINSKTPPIHHGIQN